jgi:uncharacterized repeat protein (TIGR01451 family)
MSRSSGRMSTGPHASSRRRVTATVVSILLGLSVLSFAAPAAAAPPNNAGWVPYGPVAEPVSTCAISTVYLVRNTVGGDGTLYAGTYSEAGITYTQVGPTETFSMNALALDPLTNAMYTMTNIEDEVNPTLFLPDLALVNPATGAVTPLGATDIPGSAATQSNAAAFDDSGTDWVTFGPSTMQLFGVNVTTGATTILHLSGPVGGNDLAYADGFMWAQGAGGVWRIDLSTGVVTPVTGPAFSTTGATAWTFGNGDIDFQGQELSLVNATSATPSYNLVSFSAIPPATAGGDATQCVSASTDLSIAKTGPASVAPGGAITWTLTVTNNGPADSSGFSVSDPVPSAYDLVASTDPGCDTSSNDVVCVEGPLASGASMTITLTAQALAAAAGTCVLNVATVVGNELDNTPANDSSQLQTCIGTQTFTVDKTASESPADPGDTVT